MFVHIIKFVKVANFSPNVKFVLHERKNYDQKTEVGLI